MQLVQGHEIVKFKTSKGLFKMLRCEYLALQEVMARRDIDLPEWSDMEEWNEGQFEFVPDPDGRSKRCE